jgi:pyruvate ferredoxin oxidoreductase gamma subunit
MKNLLEQQIRIHGRGGQGVVAMAEILAIAFFIDGYEVQAFPNFGVERSGAPIQSYVRISRKNILTREHIYEPDILLILDATLIGKANIFLGIKKTTKIIINTNLGLSELIEIIKTKTKLPTGFNFNNIITIDATNIALNIFGKNIVNTAMLGSLVNIPGLLKLESAKIAIKEKFSDKGQDIVEKNIKAVSQAIK